VVSRCIDVAEGRRLEVTGLVSGGVAAAGGGLCSFLLLRKDRRRMKGLEFVSDCEADIPTRKTYPMEDDLRDCSRPPAGGGPCLFLSMPTLCGSVRAGSVLELRR
jgi:hypothetical protein